MIFSFLKGTNFCIIFIPEFSSITKEEFDLLYTTGPLLGKGGFGTVVAGVRNSDQVIFRFIILSSYLSKSREKKNKFLKFKFFFQYPVAIKRVAKNRPLVLMAPDNPSEREQFVLQEVALMMQTRNIPGVIQLIDHFELPDCYMIVMERMGTSLNSSKDLFDFISESGALKEDLARHIFQQIVTTIIKVHKAGVTHRDIKDENILIDTRTYSVKLIDFGSGAKLHSEVYSDFDGEKCHN